MSTELVAIEKIEIRHGDKNADEIRMELVKYLRQFRFCQHRIYDAARLGNQHQRGDDSVSR